MAKNKKEESPDTDSRSSDGLKSLWRLVSEYLPQIFFEGMEFLYNFYGYFQLKKALKRDNYDLIYERYALNTFFAAILSRRFGLPLVLEINDATVIERSRPLILKRVSAAIEKWIFGRANLLITITNHFKQLIVDNHKVDPGKILVTPNAINPDRFRLDPLDRPNREREIRDAFKIDSDFIAGCVGAFVPWHGLEFMLKSLHDIIEEYNVHILCVGDGPVRPDIEQLAIKLGIPHRLSFTGFIDAEEVPRFIDIMDMCLIPGSNHHCSPVKLFEYMAMGKPTVLPRYGPLLDTIVDGNQGLFFDPEDAAGFRDCVISLLKDEKLRFRLGKNANHTVYEKHTWENNARRILKSVNN